ncbi:MAG: hypothetical protein ACE5GD_04430 [Candidatus Geothermarchaeales archaeon]
MCEKRVEQKRFKIGDTYFGGEVGKRATVLIGSLFYKGDKSVESHGDGVFDKGEVTQILEEVEELSEKTGVPYGLDVIAQSAKAMRSYLSFLCEKTDAPLFIDGLSEDARVEGYRYSSQTGIASKCAVNTLTLHTSEGELEEIKNAGIEAALLQAMGSDCVTPDAKIKVLRSSLIPMAERAMISKILVDVGVLDASSIVIAAESIRQIKDSFGLPAGCAPSNAAYAERARGGLKLEGVRSLNVAFTTFLQVFGADFIIFGPLKAARYIFATSAVIDALFLYRARLGGEKIDASLSALIRFLASL